MAILGRGGWTKGGVRSDQAADVDQAAARARAAKRPSESELYYELATALIALLAIDW